MTYKTQMRILIGLIVACVLVMVGVLVATSLEGSKCRAQGGQMVRTGTTTYYTMVGKVMVPQQAGIYTCKF